MISVSLLNKYSHHLPREGNQYKWQPIEGFEPPTASLQVKCSTTELCGHLCGVIHLRKEVTQFILVDAEGFEPPTSWFKTKHSAVELYVNMEEDVGNDPTQVLPRLRLANGHITFLSIFHF